MHSCFKTFVLALLSLSASAGSIDQVVLVVNDRAITTHEYKTLALIHNPEALGGFLPVLGTEPTMSIVNDQLLLGQAKALGLSNKFTEVDVSGAVSKLASQNKLASKQFLSDLSAKGIDVNVFRESLKERLLIESLVQGRVARSVNVTEADVRAFLANNAALLASDEANSNMEFELVHLLVPLKATLNEVEKASQMQLAKRVQQQILNGTKVSAILAVESGVSVSAKEGYLGWKKASQLPDIFISALKSAQSGETLPIISSPNGLHVLKLIDSRGHANTTEYQARHILLRVSTDSTPEEVENKAIRLREQLLSGASFTDMAVEHSQDPGSRSKGGSLGWVQSANLVPAFGEAIKTLPMNQVSQPIRSQFGYHLIEVLAHRAATADTSQIESQARQLIFSQRVNEKMEDLLNDLRQVAYIEVIQP